MSDRRKPRPQPKRRDGKRAARKLEPKDLEQVAGGEVTRHPRDP
jgi:hypothetical protein